MKKLVFLFLLSAIITACSPKPDDKLLVVAAAICDVPLVQELLKKGANPNAVLTDINSETNKPEILSTALDSVLYTWGEQPDKADDCEKIADILLAAGADPNKEDYIGGTAVMSLTGIKGEKGTAVLHKLIKAGADVHHRRREGKGLNALVDAVIFNNETMVRELLKLGVNPNAADSNGGTVLLTAVILNKTKDNERIIKDLLDAGADVNAKAGAKLNGVTPLLRAEKNGNKKIIALLREYGVKQKKK